jgi:hypothetical protein
MKEVLVSVASQGRENYNQAQLNLIRSSLNTNNGRNWYGELAYPHYTPIKPYLLNWGVG